MLRVALTMLTSDRGKYLGLVTVIAFASLLIAQQASIFCGVMRMTTSRIRDVKDAAIWVMNPRIDYIEEVQPLPDTDLYRIRGVSGVQWAVPLLYGNALARLFDGNYQQIILMGIDDATLVGAPRTMVRGSIDSLRRPDGIIVDERGYDLLWPHQPHELGRTVWINDHRAVLVGICKASLPFDSFPIVYMRYSQAARLSPFQHRLMSFVLAQHRPELTREEVCARITSATGLCALPGPAFGWKTIWFYLTETGIPLNFAITVMLGFLVGTAVSGQTFYLFTLENLKQFATLKAMGTSDLRIVGMIVTQAAFVGLVGYGIGIGLASIFGQMTEQTARLAFFMPWEALVLTGSAVLMITLVASLVGIRRILLMDPAMVFRS